MQILAIKKTSLNILLHLRCLGLLFFLWIISYSCAYGRQSKGVSQSEILKMVNDARKKAGMPGNITQQDLQKMGGMAVSPPVPNSSKMPYFPPLNLAKIQSLPKKTLSKTELTAYVAKILDKIKAKMDVEEFDALANLIDTLKDKPDSLAQLSVMLFNSVSPAQATYMSGKVILLDVKNELNINNFGSMLNLSGKEEYAIPVLKSILKGNEKNDMLLNNIGQSFAGLGQRDSAMYYFDKCLKQNPAQPAARSAAAVIQILKGNKTKAAEYLEHSADEIPIEEMEELSNYVKLKNPPLYTPFKRVPDYFNLYKFRYPEFQTNVYDFEKAYAAQSEFTALIDAEISRLEAIIQHEQELGKKGVKTISSPQLSPVVLQASKMMAKGYTSPGQLMAMAAAKTNYDMARKEAKTRYLDKIKEIESIYKERIDTTTKKVGEGGVEYRQRIEEMRKELCDKQNTFSNAFLIEASNISEDFTQKQLNYAAQRFYFESKWNTRAGVNEHMAIANYYLAAVRYLKTVRLVYDFEIIPPFCKDYDRGMNKIYDRDPIFTSGCEFNVSLNTGPVTYKLDCKSVSWSWATALRIKYVKNFETKKSQVQFGVGKAAKTSIGGEIGGIGVVAGAKADVAAVAFLDFDGKGGITDAGIKVAAVGSVNAGVEMRLIPKKAKSELKDYEATDPKLTIGQEAGAEVSAGINSKFQYKPIGLLNLLF